MGATTGTTAVLVNAMAGRSLAESLDAQRLDQLFGAAGMEADLRFVEPADLPAALTELKQAGVKTIVVGGGDGTVNTAANLLRGSSAALGVLPLGTFNHFARDIGMPVALDQAVQALATGRVEAVDVVEIDGRVFVNNASLGVYPYIVRHRERVRQQLGLSKMTAMGYALLGALWRLPLLSIRVHLDGRDKFVRSPFIFVGNNRYTVEPVAVVGRKSLTEGVMSVFYPRRIGRLALLKIVFNALCGRMQRVPELEQRWTDAVIINTRRRMVKLAMDGEVATMRTPLEFRIRPRALKVIRPLERKS